MKDVQVVNSKLIYSVGDQKPHTFQIDNNKILICDLKYFIKFLKEFKAKDEFLRFMIKSFVYQNDKPIQKMYKKQ